MHVLNSEGVEKIEMKDCKVEVIHDGLATKITPPHPVPMKNGDVWEITTTFDLMDD
jgi:hypothetical protein